MTLLVLFLALQHHSSLSADFTHICRRLSDCGSMQRGAKQPCFGTVYCSWWCKCSMWWTSHDAPHQGCDAWAGIRSPSHVLHMHHSTPSASTCQLLTTQDSLSEMQFTGTCKLYLRPGKFTFALLHMHQLARKIALIHFLAWSYWFLPQCDLQGYWSSCPSSLQWCTTVWLTWCPAWTCLAWWSLASCMLHQKIISINMAFLLWLGRDQIWISSWQLAAM